MARVGRYERILILDLCVAAVVLFGWLVPFLLCIVLLCVRRKTVFEFLVFYV